MPDALSDQALDRIFDRVGSKYVPATLRAKPEEKQRLRIAVFDASQRYETRSHIAARIDSASKRQSKLEKMLRLARRLHEECSDETLWREIAVGFELTDKPAFREHLDRLVEILNRAINVPRPGLEPVQRDSLSALELLAGEDLPQLFEAFFLRPASHSGPCLRFVAAVLSESKIGFKESSIARAITACRKTRRTGEHPRASRRRKNARRA